MSNNFHHTKTYIPKIFPIATEEVTEVDRMLYEAEMDLIDSAKKFHQIIGNPTPDLAGKHKTFDDMANRYRVLAEIYAQEYDNHFRDLSNILELEGVIVEMYSDIFNFEKIKGSTEKSTYQKNRLLILRNGFETLKRYFTKYDQLKLVHKYSVMERQRLAAENKELRTRLENIEKAENYNGFETK